MTRRITVPDDHVGLVLSNNLVDELMLMLKQIRLRAKPAKARSVSPDALLCDRDMANQAAIAGDLMLALLEAKES